MQLLGFLILEAGRLERNLLIGLLLVLSGDSYACS
jgi:hypothetical protein